MSRSRSTVLLAIFLAVVPLAWSQVSPEEAQRRLNAKLATRPASTQPLSDTDRLRAENRRLREENLSLQTEISQLRDALAKASPESTTGPATQPTAGTLQTQLVGNWRGGQLTEGNAFTLQFTDDGSYRQIWSVGAAHADSGHWNVTADHLIEMWTGATQPRRPNQWQATFEGEDKLTLTPVLVDGVEVVHGKSMSLRRVP